MKRVCLTKQTRIGNVETKKYILRAGHRCQRLFGAATLMDVYDLGNPGGTLGGCYGLLHPPDAAATQGNNVGQSERCQRRHEDGQPVQVRP